jgi:hypothetical protein
VAEFMNATHTHETRLGGRTYEPWDNSTFWACVWDGGPQYAIKIFAAQAFYSIHKI